LGTNSSVGTDCVYFQSLPAKAHENYVGVTCLNLLCVCSEMLSCVKANTPTTSTLLINLLTDVKISVFIDYVVSAQYVLLLINITCVERNIKSNDGFKTTPCNKY